MRIVCWVLSFNVVSSFSLEDYVVRYAHRFLFIPHTHDQGFGEIPPGRPPDVGFKHTIEFGLRRINEMMDELHGVV